MRHTFCAAAALFATFSTVFADTPTCSPSSPCPASAPCCSQYGQCGVGAYCLGGCDPKSSFDLQSCMAAPVCKSGDFAMNSLDDVAANTVYLGDPSSVNWVSSGKPVEYNGDSLLLTMAPSTVGTLLTSTHYIWYGKVSAKMTTSEGQGVVTAFILMSDMKDEIDFEFVGSDVTSAQSNYYFQGITDYHNMVPLDVSDTRVNTHTYEIDWQPDTLTWSIDGNVMRTLNKADTWNDTDNSYHYPQTPARVQLSLWPAGLASNGEGTIEWSGGLVNWDSDYMQNGYYFAMVQDINVECYDPPTGFSNNFGDEAYYYTSTVGTNDTVAIGNNNTILSSFMATGDNPSYNPNAPSPSSSSGSSPSSSTPSSTAQVQSVPGISGGGNAASSGESPSTGQGTGSTTSSSNDGSSGNSGSSGGSTSSSNGFSQGLDDTTGSGAPKLVAGSVVALLGFFIAALML